MNEEALKDAYALFSSKGYNGGINEFKSLIASNPDALKDSYTLFRSSGYNGDISQYSELIGLKKKGPSDSITPEVAMESPTGTGSVVPVETQPKKKVTITTPDGTPAIVEWGPTQFKSSDEAPVPDMRLSDIVGNVDATIDEATKNKLATAIGVTGGVLSKIIGLSPNKTTGEAILDTKKFLENTATAYNVGALGAQILNNQSDDVPDIERIAALKKEQNQESKKLLSSQMKGQGVGDFFDIMATNPATYLTEILTTSATQLAGGVGSLQVEEIPLVVGLGMVTGGAGARGYLAGRNSLAAEMSSRTLDKLEENGVDTTDPVQLRAAFENKELMGTIAKEIEAPSTIVAALDIVSAMVAGGLGTPVKEIAAQMAAGSLGEAGAQIAESGRITAPAAILTEAIAELPGGLAEIGFAAKTKDITRKAQVNRDIKDIEGQIESTEDAQTKDILLSELNKLRGEKNQIFKEYVDFANSLPEEQVAQLNELNQEVVKLTKAIESVGVDSVKKSLSQQRDAAIAKIVELESQVTPKAETDAVQEQTAGEIPVQPGATVGEEVAQGEPQAGPQVAAEEVVTPEEEVAPVVEDITFASAFNLQDKTAERTVSDKNAWGASGVIRERTENAGDILRELSSRGDRPDPGYIQEKIDKLRSWIPDNASVRSNAIPSDIKTIDDFNKTNLRFSNVTDGFEYLMKFNSDVVNKIRSEYEAIPTYTKEQKLAKDSVLALLNQDITGLEKNLDSLQDVVNTIKREGKLEIVKSVEPPIVESLQQEVPSATQQLTEADLPGFDRMMTELDGVIKKSEQRRASRAKTFENAMNYIVGSKAYESGTDVQRESLVRMVNKMFGKREKSAPSVGRLFDTVKDINKITMAESELLKNQIRSAARGAKEAKTAISNASKQVSDSLKELITKGRITVKQSGALVRRFSRVNPLDDISVDRFVKYATKVFQNAEYDDIVRGLESNSKKAKKNTQTKLGISEGLVQPLQRIFSIKPDSIPDSVFETYRELVDTMSKRRAVLELPEIQVLREKSKRVIDAVDFELSMVPSVTDAFNSYAEKVLDKDGKLDYAATVNKMVKEGVVTDDQGQILRDFRSSILPRAEKKQRSEAEIQEERELLLEIISESDIDANELPSKDERELAQKLADLIKTDAVETLGNDQLNNLVRVIDNINNGYLPHYAQLMVERLTAINNGETLAGAIESAKMLPISKAIAKVKSLFTGKKPIAEMIRRNPLFYIDQLFGDFKSKDIFNSVFGDVSVAQSKFENASNNIRNRLNDAEQKVFKSLRFDANAAALSKFKMTTYLRQLEFLSNPESNQVNPAAEYLQATIDQIESGRSIYSEKDAEMLQSILDEYSADGNIDMDKLYGSFNKAEKSAIEEVQKVNTELRDKAVHTAVVIRGDKISPLENYAHLNVLYDNRPEGALMGDAFINDYNNSLRPSTRAKSLIERTGTVSPINFDVFSSTARGANYVLIDYYLTEPVRTTRKMFSETDKMLKEDGVSKEKKEMLNSIESVFEESIDNLLNKNFTSSSFADEVADFISRQGYRSVLGSLPRSVGELLSNLSFAVFFPKDMTTGIGLRNFVLSADAAKVMNAVGSIQTNRLYPNDSLSGRLIDTSIMKQAAGAKGSRAQSDVANVIQQVYNVMGVRKAVNGVAILSDSLISTPDKLVMRPMWFGSFVNGFKKASGGIEPNLDLIAQNDEQYMADNKAFIEAATKAADEKSIFTGASDNAFTGILKGASKKDQKGLRRYLNQFNSFMTRFLIYEYVTARTGIYAAMGNGSISRKQGVALLAGVTTRMAMYSVLIPILNELMISMFSDAEEEDDKTFLQRLSQGTISAVSSLLLGRDFGNIVKVPVSYGVERINQEYLDFLRDGEYDPYKDQIMFSQIPVDERGQKGLNITDFLVNTFGPFSPALRTLQFAGEKLTAAPKKEADAIRRAEMELKYRLPLEVAGQAGLIPFYKDIRKIVLAEMYKGLDKSNKSSGLDKLTKTELQMLYPEVYNEMYGPGGIMLDYEQIKKEVEAERKAIMSSSKEEAYR